VHLFVQLWHICHPTPKRGPRLASGGQSEAKPEKGRQSWNSPNYCHSALLTIVFKKSAVFYKQIGLIPSPLISQQKTPKANAGGVSKSKRLVAIGARKTHATIERGHQRCHTNEFKLNLVSRRVFS
jgi:hypothetical protein